MPTNNINSERYLSTFGNQCSLFAAHSNKKFTAKGIRDNLIIIHSDSELSETSKTVLKSLDEMEIKWTSSQKEKKKLWTQSQFQKKSRSNDLIDQLLIKCKEHGGPITSVEELKILIKSKPLQLKTKLRREIQYQKQTHPTDGEARTELYRVNNLSEKDMIENLTIIFGTESSVANEAVLFPSEDEIVDILKVGKSDHLETGSNTSSKFEVDQPLVIIWDGEGEKEWHVGFFLD